MFVFMDESGDLQFSLKGKQHFVLSAFLTTAPEVSAAAMQRLKYELLASGSRDLEFHATENSKGTRRRVIDCIKSLETPRVHSIWIDKRYTPPSIQEETILLSKIGSAMGSWLSGVVPTDIDKIILVFDSVLTGKKQDAFIKLLKPQLKALDREFRILFHPVKQDLNGQIVDYFSWALFRNLESQDSTTMKALEDSSHWDNFNLFHADQTIYWRK